MRKGATDAERHTLIWRDRSDHSQPRGLCCAADDKLACWHATASLTYGGKVVHSRYKPGTVVKNSFLGEFGYRVFERYVVQPDGTLKLTYQMTGPDFLWD